MIKNVVIYSHRNGRYPKERIMRNEKNDIKRNVSGIFKIVRQKGNV